MVNINNGGFGVNPYLRPAGNRFGKLKESEANFTYRTQTPTKSTSGIQHGDPINPINAEEWYNNIQKTMKPGDIAYVRFGDTVREFTLRENGVFAWRWC